MLNHAGDENHDAALDAFMDTLTRLFNKAAQIEREPVDTGDGILLYTSEVHLIDMAGRFPDESMSALASRLGITKGAVSQTARKLEDKGYLERVNGEGDNKTVFLRLTGPGLRAFNWHRAYHAEVNRRIGEEFSRMDRMEQESVVAVLVRLEQVFDTCPETRRTISGQRQGLK